MPVPLTARAPVEFRPPAKPDVTLSICIPTPFQRDSFAATLVRGGVIHYSQAQIRDLMLAGIMHIFGPEKFDEMRANTEMAWAAGDALDQARADRRAKEIELREKAAEAAHDMPLSAEQQKALDDEVVVEVEKIVPEFTIDEAKRVAVAVMQNEVITRFEPLRQAFANLAEQKVCRDWLTIETYVTGWQDLEFKPDGNGKGGLERHEAEYLRQQLGDTAWGEVGDFIFALHSLDEDEEKNLHSLLASMSAPTGSTAEPSSTTSSDETGSSTSDSRSEASDTGGTPATASPKTTGSSSTSTTGRGRRTARSKSSPTDAP
jgi:hypothetical protein